MSETRYALFKYGERLTKPRQRRDEAVDDAYAVQPSWHLLDGYWVRELREADHD